MNQKIKNSIMAMLFVFSVVEIAGIIYFNSSKNTGMATSFHSSIITSPSNMLVFLFIFTLLGMLVTVKIFGKDNN